jgi:hypothetical protein
VLNSQPISVFLIWSPGLYLMRNTWHETACRQAQSVHEVAAGKYLSTERRYQIVGGAQSNAAWNKYMARAGVCTRVGGNRAF